MVHTVPLATFAFLRFGDQPLSALTEAISAGGDTDSIAAIVGGWVGALHGQSGLPKDLLDLINDGPFGPSHLRRLADNLMDVRGGRNPLVADYSVPLALLRNLALYPVVLAHGFRRLVSW